MARKRNSAEAVRTKWQLADRLRTIRVELYGQRSLAEFARLMGVPVRTWYSYESGVTLPSETLLRFVELTLVEPSWLLHGEGEKFQTRLFRPAQTCAERPCETLDHDDPLRPKSLQLTGRARFESLKVALVRCDLEEPFGSADTALAELDEPARSPEPRDVEPWFFQASRTWQPTQSDSRCVRVEEDAMVPIVAPGAFIGYSDADEAPHTLEGKLVVARIHTRPIVRWFHGSESYGVLRAENPAFTPRTELIALDGNADDGPIRRVLWVGTPH